MNRLRACIACLGTDSKLYKIDVGYLRKDFNLVSGLATYKGDGLPELLCVKCCILIQKFKNFRDKCHQTNNDVHSVVRSHKLLQLFHLKNIADTTSNCCSLSYFSISNISYEIISEQTYEKYKPTVTDECGIPVFHIDTLDSEDKKHDEILSKESHPKHEADELVYEMEDEYLVYHEDITDLNNEEALSNESTSNKCLNDDVTDGDAEVEFATMVPSDYFEQCGEEDQGKHEFSCHLCVKWFSTWSQLMQHQELSHRSLEITVCNICNINYNSGEVLQDHMKDKHNYKYLCTKCNEVNSDRNLAKEHYREKHINQDTKNQRSKATIKIDRNKIPDDYPKRSVQGPEEQYTFIENRKRSRNYLTSKYRCELCYKGYRGELTYKSHMKCHDPAVSGSFQCDVCKIFTKTMKGMSDHIKSIHRYKYKCQLCKYLTTSAYQTLKHYRSHKDVKYSCPHCELVFSNVSTRQSHMRLKHSSVLCNLCGHSFTSDNGLSMHRKMSHNRHEQTSCAETVVDKSSALYCAECDVQLLSQDAYDTHLHTSSKHCTVNNVSLGRRPQRYTPRSKSSCDVCGEQFKNHTHVMKHYREHHPEIEAKRFICDVCGHACKLHANLLSHMRTHSLERPYSCTYCDRRFTMAGNRDRHLLTHTGEKPYECEHCHRRFAQKVAAKLHIQTVHLKIPYPPWNKKNKKRKIENHLPLFFNELKEKT